MKVNDVTKLPTKVLFRHVRVGRPFVLGEIVFFKTGFDTAINTVTNEQQKFEVDMDNIYTITIKEITYARL